MANTSNRSLSDLNLVISTKAWGASAPRQIAKQTTPRYVVVHHTGFAAVSRGTVSGAGQLARSIQRHHMSRGWIDSGHNFLITVGGHTLEGRHGSVSAISRGKCVQSAHAPGANDSPGIECEGHFSQGTMREQQWQALVKLVAAICRLTGISPRQIKGHRDFVATECPGNWLYAQLPRLRREVTAALAIK
jgi:hypothetical protein